MKSFSQVTSVMSDSLRTHGLCDLMGWSPPGSSVLQMSQQEYWSRLPFPSPGNLPDPGMKSTFLKFPALADGFFITSATYLIVKNRFNSILLKMIVE